MLPFTSLTAATATGPGATRDLEDSATHHTLFISATGSPSTAAVDLEGSHDGSTWFVLAQASTPGNPGSDMATVNTHLIRYVRANLRVLTGGTSPTVSATIASKEG